MSSTRFLEILTCIIIFHLSKGKGIATGGVDAGLISDAPIGGAHTVW